MSVLKRSQPGYNATHVNALATGYACGHEVAASPAEIRVSLHGNKGRDEPIRCGSTQRTQGFLQPHLKTTRHEMKLRRGALAFAARPPPVAPRRTKLNGNDEMAARRRQSHVGLRRSHCALPPSTVRSVCQLRGPSVHCAVRPSTARSVRPLRGLCVHYVVSPSPARSVCSLCG